MKNLFFIGIDLGGKKKKTTGICILEKNQAGDLIFVSKERIFGKDLLKKIFRYLPATRTIAIDAPLTKGRGKGKMRLYEKFLSQKIFRQAHINPVPPALMLELCQFALEIKKKIKKRGFVLDINLIETFPTFLKEIVEKSKFFQPLAVKKIHFLNEDEEMAFFCAVLALWHSKLKTRYLGYKDGFLFLPEMTFWRKDWRKKFYQVWLKKDRLKYRHLITNLLNKF